MAKECWNVWQVAGLAIPIRRAVSFKAHYNADLYG